MTIEASAIQPEQATHSRFTTTPPTCGLLPTTSAPATFTLAGKTFGNRVMRTASSDQPDRVASITLLGAGGEIPPAPDVQQKYLRFTDPHDRGRGVDHTPSRTELRPEHPPSCAEVG